MSGLGFPAAWCEAPSISVGMKDAAVSGSFAWPSTSQHRPIVRKKRGKTPFGKETYMITKSQLFLRSSLLRCDDLGDSSEELQHLQAL